MYHHETPQTITNHHITSQTTMNHHKPPRNIPKHHEPSRNITNHHEPPQMRDNNPIFQLKLHVLVNISVNSRRICTKPSQSKLTFRDDWNEGQQPHVLTKTERFGQYLSQFPMDLHETFMK